MTSLDDITSIEHQVQIGLGRSLHVTETFSRQALLRDGPRRAMILLPGPVSRGSFFDIDVPGYHAGILLAQRGFFAYAVDFEGTGASTYPEHGTAVTLKSQVEAVRDVVSFVRRTREVPRVDLLGESWGGAIAAELSEDEQAVRSCIMASMIYKTPSELAQAQFQSKEWHAFLKAQPNGYLETSAPLYAQLAASSPLDVQRWTEAAQPGRYTVQPLFELFDLPFFDPGKARVPGLLIQGENDPDSLPSDAQQLAADYGPKGAAVVMIAGGGHVPRIESAPHKDLFWDAVTTFTRGLP